MPATRDDLFARLSELGIATTTREHAPFFTVADSRALRGGMPGGHTKNLFLKDKKGALFLVVASEDTEIDLKRLHTRLGCGRLSFGKADLLMEVLGVVPGSVTPFAVINDTSNRVRLVLDAALLSHELLNFHPLTNEATTAISRDDLLRFLGSCGHAPRVIDLAGPAASSGERL